MKTFDGHEKSLLRAASSDLLPRSVLERRKSPYPSTQDPAYAQALRTQLAAVLANPLSPALPLLDTPRARALATDTDAPMDPISRAAVDQALMLNAWLTEYPIQLQL